jgi:hypothetical protein
LDNEVWRFVSDYIIENPTVIRRQVQVRQNELQAQKDDMTSDIAKARQKIIEIDSERAFYQRQTAKGNITEDEFERRMSETMELHHYWEDQIEHLTELRDDAEKVKAGLDYSEEFLNTLNSKRKEIDHSVEELRALPEDERASVLLERQKIIRALCDKVFVYPDGRIEAEGVLDGSEMQHFSEPCSIKRNRRVGAG